jgi:hypothetical protein
MRISLLLEREPFGKVLEKTFAEFLSERFGRVFGVKWKIGRVWPHLSADNTAQVWLCNPYLNAIFVPNVRKQVLLPIIQEYSRNRVGWKRPLQKGYVATAIRPVSSWFFATYRLDVTPGLEHPENFLLMGGNNHIRFHDYEAGKAYVITKSGFDINLMQNELNVRVNNPFLPCPELAEKATTWYSETLVSGTPLNRLDDPNRVVRAIRELTDSLFQLYQKSVVWDDLERYSEALLKEIQYYTQKCCLDQDSLSMVTNNAKAVKDFLVSLKSWSSYTVPLVQTHGDFQPGNILVDDDKTWLIDWEYTAPRQAAYDLLVFVTQSRFRGFSERVSAILSDNLLDGVALLEKCPYIDWTNLESKKIMLGLFLFEELLLKLKQDAPEIFQKPSVGFGEFLDEMRISVGILEAA